MKQLERLLFQQGGRCFFCDKAIPEGEASVEHLIATSNDGPKADENCVVCCKTLNAALGNLSVKRKIEIVLKQRSAFSCPATVKVEVMQTAQAPSTSTTGSQSLIPAIVENLRKYKDKLPVRIKTLRNAILGSFPQLDEDMMDGVISELEAQGLIVITGVKVDCSGLITDA